MSLWGILILQGIGILIRTPQGGEHTGEILLNGWYQLLSKTPCYLSHKIEMTIFYIGEA